jgi:serine/threonine protein kinase
VFHYRDIHVAAMNALNPAAPPNAAQVSSEQPATRLDPAEAEVWPTDWLLVRRIATGRTSRVYGVRRRDSARGPLFALKLPRVGGPRDEEFRQIRRREFAAEAENLSAIRDPRVPRLVEAALDHAVPYLVMDHVAGVPLERWRLRRRQDGTAAPCRWAEVHGFAQPLIEAVANCHAAGVVHTDVVARNIILGAGGLGDPRLVDFGNATSLTAVPASAHASYRRLDMYGVGLLMLSLLSDEATIPLDCWGALVHRYAMPRARFEDCAQEIGVPVSKVLGFFDAALSLLDDRCFATAADMAARLALLRPPGDANGAAAAP